MTARTFVRVLVDGEELAITTASHEGERLHVQLVKRLLDQHGLTEEQLVATAMLVLAVVIFAVLQSVLTPWAAKVARKNAPAFLGGIGIVSTFVALVVVVLIPGAGLTIGAPWWTWIAAPVIVWIVTALATWLLPALFIKKKVADRRER